MTYSMDPAGAAGDFPKVATGEYPFTIDELHMVRFDGDEFDKVRVFFNLGVRQTTKGETEEVRLAKTFKPSLFTGSAKYREPAGWVLLCQAVGIDPRAALADLESMLGRSGIAPVVREPGNDGKDKNTIGTPMPLGAASAPSGVTPKGVTDKRDPFAATTRSEPVPVGADATDLF